MADGSRGALDARRTHRRPPRRARTRPMAASTRSPRPHHHSSDRTAPSPAAARRTPLGDSGGESAAPRAISRGAVVGHGSPMHLALREPPRRSTRSAVRNSCPAPRSPRGRGRGIDEARAARRSPNNRRALPSLGLEGWPLTGNRVELEIHRAVPIENPTPTRVPERLARSAFRPLCRTISSPAICVHLDHFSSGVVPQRYSPKAAQTGFARPCRSKASGSPGQNHQLRVSGTARDVATDSSCSQRADPPDRRPVVAPTLARCSFKDRPARFIASGSREGAPCLLGE